MSEDGILTCGFVLGTRPEVIKLAPLFMAMKARPEKFRPLLWVTGQHRELIEQALNVFGLVPDADFGLMQENQSQTALVGKILVELDTLISVYKPNWILVQGDTSSALAGALAGFYAGIKVVHIEAGLRTFNLAAPFPEEGNRQLISRIAHLHCTPTLRATNCLLQEQISDERIVQSGNTVVDAIRWVTSRHIEIPFYLEERFKSIKNKNWVLTSLHRRESFGPSLVGMLEGIRELADDDSLNLAFIFPVHPNPNVKFIVNRILDKHPRIALLDPLNYFELATVLKQCWLVLTDSGGLQEEAPSLHKPVLVLRDETERPEGVETGAAELVGTDRCALIASVRRLVDNPVRYQQMVDAVNPYGSGMASQVILDAIQKVSVNLTVN